MSACGLGSVWRAAQGSTAEELRPNPNSTWPKSLSHTELVRTSHPPQPILMSLKRLPCFKGISPLITCCLSSAVMDVRFSGGTEMQLPFVNRLLKMLTASYFSIPTMKKICQPMFLNWPDTQGIHHRILHTAQLNYPHSHSQTIFIFILFFFFTHIVSSSHPIPSSDRIYGRVEECPPAD